MYSIDDHMLHCPPLPSVDRNWKSATELAPNCPRCASSNTKFCYYNNYSLSQPRYFCKGCRRYWTKGGSLRNVPVGGGCRRNRRAKSARLLQSNRKSFSSLDPNQSSPQSDSTSEPGSSNASSDIDLAVVFAKFLNNNDNQNTSFSPEFVSQESAPTDETNSNSLKSNGGQSDSIQKVPQLLLTPLQEQTSIQEFWETDMNALGLQNLLNDEAVQDALWPDAATMTAANLSWQPVMQMQELDSFAADHDLLKNFSTNLVTDHWSTSLDPTSFEIFSKP
ncbi:hypothetical protein SLA2020_068630 [Shorea laevis]